MTITLDRELLRMANKAVAAGRAESVSAWINRALEEQAKKDDRQRAGLEAIAAYEARFGKITDAEMAAAQREARRRAIVVGGRRRARRANKRAA